MKKIVITLLVVFGFALILATVSFAVFPQWLAIPGGLFILFGAAFDAVLSAGSKIKDWVDLLFVNKQANVSPSLQSNYGEIKQQGGSNIIATNIDHLEVHNALPSDNFHRKTSNLTDKQKSALASLVHLGNTWREDFYIVWHEPIGLSDILDYDGNPPQISKGDVRAFEREGLVICEFMGSNKAHITLMRKSFDSISAYSEDIDLTIVPQVKEIDGDLYIIINVLNNENRTVFCRAEIQGIFDNTGQNIKREISQYANLFSWSGGSQSGAKEILSGLDGTINLILRRTSAYGFYFLFHENPGTNWKKQGVYKLDIAIRGTIGELEFDRKIVTICFEYIEKEERDSMGSFYNRGILKLLEWNIEKNTHGAV